MVQLDELAGSTLAVIHQSWLTPLKKEVLWPPIKERKAFRKALTDGLSADNNWRSFGIERVFYATG